MLQSDTANNMQLETLIPRVVNPRKVQRNTSGNSLMFIQDLIGAILHNEMKDDLSIVPAMSFVHGLFATTFSCPNHAPKQYCLLPISSGMATTITEEVDVEQQLDAMAVCGECGGKAHVGHAPVIVIHVKYTGTSSCNTKLLPVEIKIAPGSGAFGFTAYSLASVIVSGNNHAYTIVQQYVQRCVQSS